MPLPLEQVAMPLGGDTGNFLGAATECHTTVLFWLYHATYGHLPAQLDDIYPKLIKYSTLMAAMARRGVQLHANHRLDVPLIVGSVLIFEQNGDAAHSCVVKTAKTIAGNNQTNWFREDGARTKGVRSKYTIHQAVDIPWTPPFPSSTVTPSSGKTYRLMMVPQAAALDVFQR